MTASGQLIYYSARGTIYYSPGDLRAEELAPARLPIPPFQPRQRRPHSIHITRYPVGFQFYDPPPTSGAKQYYSLRRDLKNIVSRENAKRIFDLVRSPLTSISVVPSSSTPSTRSVTPDLLRTNSTLPLPADLAQDIIRQNIPPSARETMATTMATRGLHNLGGPSRSSVNLSVHDARKQATSTTRPAPNTHTGSGERPLASANGVSCSIILAEPTVYLNGFDRNNHTHSSQNSTALLRGKMILTVTKAAKIKAVTLTFLGKGRTEWPEGIPPDKTKYYEEEKLRQQVLPFFDATFPNQGDGYGRTCIHNVRNPAPTSSSTNLSTANLNRSSSPAKSSRTSTLASSKEVKRLSLGAVQSRSFTKGESPYGQVHQQKNYTQFPPGTYEYPFEIALDHTSPETIDFPLGSVKWYLEALVQRAGTFKPNLHGVKEVVVIRAPDQNSLEQVEPIAISRKWEDQLHYDIVISGKSFAIGSKIPIAFKLTPLAKVQCHRIKVFITENVDYYCNDKKVTRKDQQRKILLLERQAGKPLEEKYESSSVRIVAGGELDAQGRETARKMAQRKRDVEARSRNTAPQPLPQPTENLLGDLDLGLDYLIGQTEIEMDVQLPTCAQMRKHKELTISPDTTYKNIQVHHWIKIVLRLSRLDTEDPTGTKRRHFEISIDSPFHILSCLATQAHTSLPEYSDSESFHGHPSTALECGCPNAAVLSTFNISPSSSTGSIPTLSSHENPAGSDVANAAVPELAPPPQAHLPNSPGVQRPMHMLRQPSFSPPAFDAEEPPPPIPTPPPQYDIVVGTPSHDGLADYFARLSDVYSDDEDDDLTRVTSRTGRVNIANPRTPGGRTARSMEIDRGFMFRPNALENRMREGRPSQDTMRGVAQ